MVTRCRLLVLLNLFGYFLKYELGSYVRLHFVQPQYVFIHHALLEKLVVGNVVFPCRQFQREFFHLCLPPSAGDINKLQLQYDVSYRLYFAIIHCIYFTFRHL